jgi:predicted DNA-binding transcriptional regulator AlpA
MSRPPLTRNAADNLPPELSRQRVLHTPQALNFVGVSAANWRRLRARGEAPAAIKLGLRKQGYRLGDLIDWLESRKAEQPAA